MWGRHSILLMLMLALAGCGCGHARSAAEPSTMRPLIATTTSTTVAKGRPLYSFDNSVPPPQLINTGTDYPRIINSLLEYGDWLYAHRPAASLIRNIAAPSSKVETAFLHDLPTLERLNRRFYEVDAAPIRVSIISANRDTVSARVVQSLRTQDVVAADGKIVSSHGTPTSTTTYSLLLTRSADGRWYVTALDESRAP